MRLDLVIRGGLLVDGSGAPGRVADVGLAGGRLAAVAPAGSSLEGGPGRRRAG